MNNQLISKKKALLGGSRFSRLSGDCSGFLSQGCKQVPPEPAGGKILWGHPEGYFLRSNGQIAKHTFAPSQVNNKGGSSYPGMRECLPRPCHVIMAITFYGARPKFIDSKTGKEYGAVCHHIIPDKLDYRPANLLCWLTREQHYEADRRQRLIKKAVGIEGMRELGYDLLRKYQDPRVTSAIDFENWLTKFKEDQL